MRGKRDIKLSIVSLLLLTLVLCLCGCMKYSNIAYSLVRRSSEIFPDSGREVEYYYGSENNSGIWETASAEFVADSDGRIYTNIFNLQAPGYFESVHDLETGVFFAGNSRGTLVYYKGNFYRNGKQIDLGMNCIAVGIADTKEHRVFLDIKWLEDYFGVKAKFNKQDKRLEFRFARDVTVGQSQVTVDISRVNGVIDTQILHTGGNHIIYYSKINIEGARAHIEVINSFIDWLEVEGYQILDRAGESEALLAKGERYVCVKASTEESISVCYIN